MAPPIDVSRFEQLKASGDLPSPKGVALAIMRMTQQDDLSITALAQVIRSDPAFVGRLIKAANGLIGYGRRPIVSVQDALTVLGMPAVRNMALGFSLLTHYRSGACDGFDYGRYWSSSLLQAVATQTITIQTRVAAPDETYCLGLLARVGELALATLYPHDYAKILLEVGGDLQRLGEMESQAFAMTSAELGTAMLSDWGLPRLFTDAAFCVASASGCTHPEGSRNAILTHTLTLAVQLSELCLADPQDRSAHLRRVKLAASRLSFDDDVVISMGDAVAAEWLEWGALLNVPAGKMPPLASVDQAAEQPDVAQDPVLDSLSPPSEERALRVLLAEADAPLRRELKQALTAAGCDVAEAGEGFLATERALDFHPDMLLLGWNLADMPGLDLLRSLRKTRIGRSIFTLVLGEDASKTTVDEAFSAGADDLLSKPLNMDLLVAKIRAGRRLTALQYEIERDREEIHHFAAELAVSNRRLQEAALLDPLTECPNRRFLNERLTQEWATSVRTSRPLSCLVLDIDSFKAVNDNYGHDIGDAVLRQLANAIRSALRGQDLLARSDGDAFIVLCPDTAIEAAMACAERVRCAVADSNPNCGSGPLNLSVSIGVACKDSLIMDSESLLKRAGQGLYQAKQEGRNRVAAPQL